MPLFILLDCLVILVPSCLGSAYSYHKTQISHQVLYGAFLGFPSSKGKDHLLGCNSLVASCCAHVCV